MKSVDVGLGRAYLLRLLALLVLVMAGTAHAAVTWTGNSGIGWETPGNWSNNLGPTVADAVSYTNAGSTPLLGDVTSLLNTSRTIGGISFNNTNNAYHTLDLNGHTLTVTGNINVNVDQVESSIATIRNGTMIINGAFANMNVGRAVSASTTGHLDLTGLTALTTNMQEIQVGTSISGSSFGMLKLPSLSSITATRIVVGQSNNVAQSESGAIVLGMMTTIVTPQFSIGQDYSDGNVSIASGGTLNLGTNLQRTALWLANSSTNTNNLYTGVLNLTGATLNGYLSDLIVGQRITGGGVGTTSGTFIAGNAGTLNIGVPGNTAVLYVGRSLSGTSSGIADLSGMGTVTASLSTLAVGQAVGGSATGNLKLGISNNISATTVIVGSGANDSTGTLTLGFNTTVLSNSWTIGRDYGSGTVQSGGTVTIGSPEQRTSISIATGNTNTQNTHTGTLDLSNATVTAYLDQVIVGDKNDQPGNKIGSFLLSTNPRNHVEINSLLLGGTRSTGYFVFGGGMLYAGAITRGAGTANFIWNGGQLSVTSFGSPSNPFNLSNTVGVLAPGLATGEVNTTTVYGNYTQGNGGTLWLRIAGNAPGFGNDQLVATGSASFAGRLALQTINEFEPAVGQTFLIAAYASRTGTFSFVAPPKLPPAAAFQLDYITSPTQLVVRMVSPVVQNWTSTAAAAQFSTAANWDTNAVPGTINITQISNPSGTPRTVTVATSTTVHRVVLSGTGAALNFEVPQGIKLGVANELVVGSGAQLTGAGQVIGDVVVTGSGMVAAQSAGATLIVEGSTSGGGNIQATNGGTLRFQGSAATLSGNVQAINGTIAFASQVTTLSSPLMLTGGSVSFSSGVQQAAQISGSGTVSVPASRVLVSQGVTLTGSWVIGGTHGIQAGSGDGGTSRVSAVPQIAKAGAVFTGTLDLADNALIIDTTSAGDKSAKLAAVLAAVSSGRHNGDWLGTGITSSTVAQDHGPGGSGATALGVYDNAILNLSTFGGKTVGANTILVGTALIGDTNFDQVVNDADFDVVVNNWQQSRNNWARGDLNSDGFVDILDAVLVASHWEQTLNAATGMVTGGEAFPHALPGATVPEPAFLLGGLMVIPLLASGRRRRGRSA